MAKTVPATPSVPSDGVFAAGEPVPADAGAALAQGESYLYERVNDAAVPGNALQTVTGHDHSGAGNGAPIWHFLFSQSLSVPEFVAADAPNTIDSSGYVDPIGPTVAAVALRTLSTGVVDWNGGAAGANEPQPIGVWPIRLHAGAIGVHIDLLFGAEWTSDVLVVASDVRLDTDWTTAIDPAVYPVAADLNMGLRSLTAFHPQDYIEVNAGAALAADADYTLFVTGYMDSAGAKPGIIHAHAIRVYEVV